MGTAGPAGRAAFPQAAAQAPATAQAASGGGTMIRALRRLAWRAEVAIWLAVTDLLLRRTASLRRGLDRCAL